MTRSLTPGSLMILALLVGASCSPRSRGADDRVARSSSAERCRGLPARRTPPATRECASPRNSDGTSKALGPAPPSEPGHTLLFRYEDFGPPSMADGLLGSEWWSWEAGGSFERCDAFDVRVVVHDGRRLEDTRARYPTVRGVGDYRLVDRGRALRYLDERIAELGSAETEPEERALVSLRRDLEHTRLTILECLPP